MIAADLLSPVGTAESKERVIDWVGYAILVPLGASW